MRARARTYTHSSCKKQKSILCDNDAFFVLLSNYFAIRNVFLFNSADELLILDDFLFFLLRLHFNNTPAMGEENEEKKNHCELTRLHLRNHPQRILI